MLERLSRSFVSQQTGRSGAPTTDPSYLDTQTDRSDLDQTKKNALPETLEVSETPESIEKRAARFGQPACCLPTAR
jgi:hypothetical protein